MSAVKDTPETPLAVPAAKQAPASAHVSAPKAVADLAAGPEAASSTQNEPEFIELSPEAKARQYRRSIAVALALGFLVVLFYAATMVRLGGNVVNRAM